MVGAKGVTSLTSSSFASLIVSVVSNKTHLQPTPALHLVVGYAPALEGLPYPRRRADAWSDRGWT